MNFQDTGIIIAKKFFQENANIVSVFTKEHGIRACLIKQSGKSKSGVSYQIGNLVHVSWRARLGEHLGRGILELERSYVSTIMQNKLKLYAMNSIIALIKLCFKEHEPNAKLFSALAEYLSVLSESRDFDFPAYIQLELMILEAAGYKLSLHKCCVTNVTQNLCYVSPKSGCAVSQDAGLPYAAKLLPLPEFLACENYSHKISTVEIRQALDLTSYFFKRYLVNNLPQERSTFVSCLLTN